MKVQSYGRQLINGGITSVLASNSSDLSKVVSALRPSDFKSIANSSKLSGVLNLVAASSSSKSVSNVQVIINF